MKRHLLLSLLVFLSLAAGAQERRFSCAVTAGVGISLNAPSSTPFTAQVTGYYNISRRFSVGAGAGVSCYEKALIPLFGEAKILLTRPRKFTPFAACGAGYAFAPARDANGGLYFCPAVGVQYALRGRLRLFFAAGYEVQKLERLKSYDNRLFSAQFSEKLRHNSLSLRIGVLF